MKYVKLLSIFVASASALGLALLLGIYFYIKPDLPSVEVLKDVRLQTPMKIYTQDGKLISQYGVKRRIPLKLEQVPEQLVQAVLATEDSRFYEHPGIDPIGVARAFVNLVITGEKGQGASTLTMQLARSFFLTRDKTFIRKIKEVFLAWHIEQLLAKNEILELYLNRYELGHRAFGVGAAAQVYYGKAVQDLSLAQMATIAGLHQAPSVLNPISNPARSVERRRIVLLRMLDEGFIDRAAFAQAAEAPVTAARHGAEIELDAPYLADVIYREMIERYGKEEAETGGYRVYATVPSNLQAAAQYAVRENLHMYDERHGYRGAIRTLWQPLQAPDVKASKRQALAESSEDGAEQTEQIAELEAPRWSEEAMLEAMRGVSPIGPLSPAVVTAVAERSATVFGRDGEYQQLDWSGLAWARKYISDKRQGDAPKTAAEILQEGEMVWVRKRESDAAWQLSQFPRATGALLAVDPHNGALRAVVGGYSFYQSQFNRATQAERQIGSNIKPFIYSAALDNGYTLASIVNDAPIHKDEGAGKAWRPKNSPPVYDGPIRMRVALGKSKNVVSVRLLQAVGLDTVREHLTNFGFDKADIPNDQTISIGSSSHTPLEVVTGMATIANGGFYVPPFVIDRIENEYGEQIWAANPAIACEQCDLFAEVNAEPDEQDVEALLEAELSGFAESSLQSAPPVRQAERVISAANAYLVSEMMRTAVRSNGNWNKKTYWLGTGWRARNVLQRTDLHGKTGTTNDARDAWFSGFNKDLVATAWVGFDDMNRQLGHASLNPNLINQSNENNWIGNAIVGSEAGAIAAQPAWIRFMREALTDVDEAPLPIPPEIVSRRIDRSSGKLTQRTDHTAMFEFFENGTEPTSFVREDEIIDPLDENSQQKQEVDEIF